MSPPAHVRASRRRCEARHAEQATTATATTVAAVAAAAAGVAAAAATALAPAAATTLAPAPAPARAAIRNGARDLLLSRTLEWDACRPWRRRLAKALAETRARLEDHCHRGTTINAGPSRHPLRARPLSSG